MAFINADAGFKLTKEEMTGSLAQHLPAYMIPSFFQTSDGFPRLPNGKINKKALILEVDESEKKKEIDFDTLTATQKKLTNIWEDILKIKNINPLGNFFDVGGNSLLAIRILNKIKEEIGFTLSFKAFIVHPTIIHSGSFIDSQTHTAAKAIELVHLTETTNLPLSVNQQRLWLISKLQPDIPSYIIPFTYHLIGSLNLEIFQKSIDLLFRRHHILFSLIKEVNGEPCCDIVPSKVDISFIDYSGLPENEKTEKVNDIFNADSRKIFDLQNGPLYRLYLIKTGCDGYYFRISIHHIVFDGWSWSVMVKDLNEIYNNLLKGKEVDLEKIEFQQYDYAQWEKSPAGSKNDNESIEFWKENLNGASTILNFPYDFQRREQPSGRGGYETIQLSQEVSEKLRKISKKEDSSLFATMLSVFGLQMQKYSGENDINIGLPVAYRPHSKLENIIGMFVNTVVVRLRNSKDSTFRNIIHHTNEAALNAIAHQDLPFETVVKIVNPERSSNANPLFQVAFAWQNNLDELINLEGIRSERITGKDRTSIFDITFYMWENGNHIEGEIEYNIDILKGDTIIRLRDNFLNLIDNLVENSDTAIGSLSMISVSDAEKEMIIAVNETITDYSKDKTIIQLFEERTVLDPEHIAIAFDGLELTYSELNIKADQLAGVLQSYNIKPGDFVGILLKRSPELIICLLAIFKSGAAYVPLNLTDPENRVMSIIDTAEIKFVITNTAHNIDLKGKCERLNIEQLINPSSDILVTNNNIMIKSEDPAYIIFTSGTTGTPKGVFVNHKSVINLIEWVNKTFEISYKDKLLWVTNLSFDLSVYDIFGMLASGGIIRILSDDDRQDPKKQYDILLNEGITFWDSAPQSLQQLTPFFNRKGDSGLYNSLRLVFLSGDWIPLSLPAIINPVFPSATVVSLGGATEATVWSNYFIIDKIDPAWKSIPYGKPIQNARYYILDEKMNHCRIQQPGNLYIGGDCLALGYYNDNILTNSKFIPDPYNVGSKLYLTGDKAQWMADGNIEFLGRDDEQIKVRGYRVEIGEIKNVVLLNKAIKEAILIPDKSDRHNIKVILFITTHDDIKLEVKDLKKELRESLPEYMIPADIIQYTEFPTTPNGKVDTKKLLSDYLISLNNNQIKYLTDKGETDIETLTPTEKIIHKLWSELLYKVEISVTDNFFDIGGNSLLAIRLINKIEEEFGFSLTFREFITNSTINQLGILIKNQTKSSEKEIKLVHSTGTTNLPLSLNQKRLWLLSKLQPDRPSYIIPFTFKFFGSLNRAIFQKSINILFQRHHIVFSVIKEVNGEPYCDIVPTEVDISFTDYSKLPENERSGKVNDIVNSDSMKVFDLVNGPLYRLYLIMTGTNEYYFHISIHHIVFDGWSWSVLVKDLNEIYNSLLRGKDVGLEDIEFQQYDYAQWERSPAGSKNEDKLKEFWKENLQGASPILNFPYDFQRKGQPSGRGKYEAIKLSQDLSEKLRKISKAEGSSLFATMLSAFGLLMQKYSGEDDINIGLPVAYRPHSKLENIFGMFVNTIVTRLIFAEEFTFSDMIRHTSEAALNAIANQELAFEKVVEIVNPERSSNANPLFQVAFDWQNNLDEPLNLDGISSERITGNERTSIFDITLYLWENGNHIEGEIEYNTDILKHDTIIRLRDNFLNLLNNLVGNSDTAIKSLSMISDEETKMIDDFNNTRTDFPGDKTIVQLFEEQVSIYGKNTAVVFKDDSLTYKQLNEKANQLARTLRKLGVRENSPVGILAEKSMDMIVGILGILKSGGGYVPIDPEYPVQRLNFIIGDSGCKVLLTQEKYMKVAIDGVTKINLNSPASYNKEKSNIDGITVSSDLAYIMYTSGTTGIPKGSMIRQKSVVRLVRNTNYINLTPGNRILLTGAIVFDATTFEIWGALLNGGSLYIAEKETILNPKALGEELVRNNITILWLTSALFTQIAESRTDIFRKLKYLLSGGDVLSAPHINKVRKDNPNLKIINGYGPTENTTFSTTYLIDRDFDYNIPIGKPISNSTVYIFDKNMNYQPIGVIGELYVGGDGVSMGYVNRDDLNMKSFIDHPHINGERLYRTGDYVRWLPDGNIEFHGRIDNQLKIRGFRVELEEIASVISEIEGIVESVIKPIKIQEGDIRLAAFLNVSDTFSMDPGEISRRIKEKLPPYMVPSAYKYLNGFPKTINGKTDRDALTLDINDLVRKESQDLKTFTPTEMIIYNIWSEAMKIEEISTTDNFFEIGGNSLLAISVFSKIESAFNVDLGLRVFFDSPRIKDLAEVIEISIHRNVEQKSYNKTEGEGARIIKGEI